MPEFAERADWQTAATGKRQITSTNTTVQARLERILSALLKVRFSTRTGLEQEAEHVEGANMLDIKIPPCRKNRDRKHLPRALARLKSSREQNHARRWSICPQFSRSSDKDQLTETLFRHPLGRILLADLAETLS